MIEPLPKLKKEAVTLDEVIHNRNKINEIVEHIRRLEMSQAPTDHVKEKNGS